MKLDQNELALRMLEAATGMTRPNGLQPTECLARLNPSMVAGWQRGAVAAICYFIECAGPLDVLPSPKPGMSPDRSSVGGKNGGEGAS